MSREAMKQPEALRLADALDDEFTQGRISNHNGRKAAVELRRLHERCDQWRDIHDAVVADSDKVYALLRQALEALDSDNPDIQLRAATYLRQALVDADDISEKRVDEKAKRELVRMAREAGFEVYETDVWITDGWWLEELERFAALVAAAEREACAELVWPTQQFKVWSDEELTAMTGAFNRAQEKHGWYETIMAVGAAALKGRAAAIRERGNK